MTTTIKVDFGAAAAPLKKQLKAAGITCLHPKYLSYLQQDAGYVNHLAIRGVLTESEMHKAKNRIMDKLVDIVCVLPTSSKRRTG